MRKKYWKYIGFLIMLIASTWLVTSNRKNGTEPYAASEILDLNPEPYAVFQSPGKKYMLVVYGRRVVGGFPGQGGDVPGEVVLRDSKGNTLRKQEVEMVQLVESPEWSESGVSVKLLFDWRYQ